MADGIEKISEQTASQSEATVDILLAKIKDKHDQTKEEQWSVKLAGRDIVIREKLNKIFKAVQTFKELGASLTSLDPIHAGLPWAGVCVIMQIAMGDHEQFSSMVAAVEEVALIIERYKHVEYICQNREDVALRDDFEKPLVDLYKCILTFQVSAACYYRRNTLLTFLRSIPKMDDVSGALSDIRRSDQACSALSQVFDTRDDILRHSQVLTILGHNKETLDAIVQQIQKLAISQSVPDRGRPEVPFIFNADLNFIGRSEMTALMDSKFEVHQRLALVGWAGVGKSGLAIEYAHRFRRNSPDSRIFWVRGARQDAFLKSYRDIARKL